MPTLSDKVKSAHELSERIRSICLGFDGSLVSAACATIAAEAVVNDAQGDKLKRDLLARLHVTTFSSFIAVAEIERGDHGRL